MNSINVGKQWTHQRAIGGFDDQQMCIFPLGLILLLPLVPPLLHLRGLLFIHNDMHDRHMSRDGTCVCQALLRHAIKHLNRYNQAMMNSCRSYWRFRGTRAFKLS
jgi:hypothetical protein